MHLMGCYTSHLYHVVTCDMFKEMLHVTCIKHCSMHKMYYLIQLPCSCYRLGEPCLCLQWGRGSGGGRGEERRAGGALALLQAEEPRGVEELGLLPDCAEEPDSRGLEESGLGRTRQGRAGRPPIC